MPEIAERLFELAKDALAEQERRLDELRTRGATLLAGGTVVASLVAPAVFHGKHPDGTGQVLAAVAGVSGGAILLVFVVLLLMPYRLGFSVNVDRTFKNLWSKKIIAQPSVDQALAEALEQRRENNDKTIRRLGWCLAVALLALVLEVGGLTLAAALSS